MFPDAQRFVKRDSVGHARAFPLRRYCPHVVRLGKLFFERKETFRSDAIIIRKKDEQRESPK